MPHASSPLRIVLADDDDQLCRLVARMLGDAGHDVVGHCGDARDVLRLVREHRPDLTLVDARMPPGYANDGLDAALQIQEELPETAVVVLSADVAVEHAVRVVAGGERSGYLLKKRVVDSGFVPDLERVAAGTPAVDRAIVDELMAASHVDDPLGSLAPHDREVLALVAEGRPDAAIASLLDGDETAVAGEVTRIFETLELPAPQDDRARTLSVLRFLDAR